MKKRVCNLNGCFCPMVGLASIILFLLAQSAPGAQVIQTLPFYDSFDYTPGGLASASSTVWETCFATGNILVTNNELTLAGFVPSAGNSVYGAAKGTRFAGTQFTSQTAADGKAVFVSFLYQVAAYPTTSPGVIAFLDSPILARVPALPFREPPRWP
jgi:hypothetical protein